MKAETPINLSSSSDVNSIVARVRACYLMACFLMVAASFGNELAGDSPSEVNEFTIAGLGILPLKQLRLV